MGINRWGGAWRMWAKALGEKASPCSKESDKIALIRTLILLSYLTTNGFIIANAIRHWEKPRTLLQNEQIERCHSLGPY
jgi:hypothetical protein